MIKAYHKTLGLVDINVIQVDAAINEYDERLYLDKHPETGDWVVMIRMERPSAPYPVYGFQYVLPSAREVVQKLRETDSQREDIRKNIIKYNEEREKALDYEVKQNVAAGAELVEHIARKEGRIPEYKSYRKVTPKKKAKRK